MRKILIIVVGLSVSACAYDQAPPVRQLGQGIYQVDDMNEQSVIYGANLEQQAVNHCAGIGQQLGEVLSTGQTTGFTGRKYNTLTFRCK